MLSCRQFQIISHTFNNLLSCGNRKQRPLSPETAMGARIFPDNISPIIKIDVIPSRIRGGAFCKPQQEMGWKTDRLKKQPQTATHALVYYSEGDG